MAPAPVNPPVSAAQRRRVRVLLVVILLIGVAPIIASYAFYWTGGRSQQVNYGTLLATAVPDLRGTRLDGTPFALASLRRRWVILTSAAAACDADCEHALYATRQARTMQNADRDRVVRLWLVAGAGTPAPALLAEHPDLIVVRVAPSELDALPAHGRAIYLVDPRGNLVLAWPTDPDIKALAKDLGRLLRLSQIG